MAVRRISSLNFCQLMWKGNVFLGSALTLLGGMVCYETNGYSVRFNMFGFLMNGFVAGNLAVLLGISAVLCSVWRIRE